MLRKDVKFCSNIRRFIHICQSRHRGVFTTRESLLLSLFITGDWSPADFLGYPVVIIGELTKILTSQSAQCWGVIFGKENTFDKFVRACSNLYRANELRVTISYGRYYLILQHMLEKNVLTKKFKSTPRRWKHWGF